MAVGAAVGELVEVAMGVVTLGVVATGAAVRVGGAKAAARAAAAMVVEEVDQEAMVRDSFWEGREVATAVAVVTAAGVRGAR